MSSNKKPILEMRHVTKCFPGVVALDDVSIQVYSGEILAICGENGAGKSTLMKILSGNYISGTYEGEILIDSKKVNITSVLSAKRQGIEMVYQEQNVMMDASIAENIFVGNLPHKGIFVDYKILYKNTEELLTKVGYNIDPYMKVRSLGSGIHQMISILRALVSNPQILVMDEPTSALADKEVETLMGFLRALRKKGISCLFISHKLQEIAQIADRVLVIRDGRAVSCLPIEKTDENTLIEHMIGRSIEKLYPPKADHIGKEVLRVEGLTIPHPAVKGKNIIQDVAFSLHEGEILGIGGLVGAGRTEILGAIFSQFVRGVKKNVFIDDKEQAIRSPWDAIKNSIGYIPEERRQTGIVWLLNIRENLTLASLDRIPNKFIINRKYEKQVSQKMVENLRVKTPSTETVIVNLSGGNQQKVVFGKWLMRRPRILLIDEPTKGIDVGAKAELYKIMRELTDEGLSIILVSSDMPELVSMSDRCIVISNGGIKGEFRGDNITQTNIMKAAISD